MTTATMTSNGQITIPVSVRASLGIKAGDRLDFIQVESGRFELIAAGKSVTALKGMIRKPAASITVKTMNESIVHQGAKAK